MCDTIEDETKVLDDFSIMYPKLMSGGSENKEVAEILVKAFFENRNYDEKNIQEWLKWLLDEDREDIDHWKYLGVPGTDQGLLGDAPSYKDIEEAVIEKIQNGVNKETIINTLSSKINGRVVLDEKNVNYEMYTILHSRDFLNLLYDENIGKHKPKEDETSKKDTKSEKDTAQKETTDKQSKEENVKTDTSEKKDSVDTEAKEDKSSTVQNESSINPLPEQQLRALILKSIRNGGVLDDVLFIPEVENLVKTGLRGTNGTQEFDDMDKVKEVIEPL